MNKGITNAHEDSNRNVIAIELKGLYMVEPSNCGDAGASGVQKLATVLIYHFNYVFFALSSENVSLF